MATHTLPVPSGRGFRTTLTIAGRVLIGGAGAGWLRWGDLLLVLRHAL
jgi:hypothetical protein